MTQAKAGDMVVRKYVRKWLKAIGPEKRKLLRQLYMVEDAMSNRTWLRDVGSGVEVRNVKAGTVKSRMQLLKREEETWTYRRLEFGKPEKDVVV